MEASSQRNGAEASERKPVGEEGVAPVRGDAAVVPVTAADDVLVDDDDGDGGGDDVDYSFFV